MELTEGRSIVVDFQTTLSVDKFRIQLYNHPIVQQIALAEFQQTFQSHSSLRLRGGMSPRNEYVNNDSKFNEIPYLTNMKFLWNGDVLALTSISKSCFKLTTDWDQSPLALIPF